MPISTTGPKGNAVMTAPEAQGASGSRAKRLLFKDIFNIAITKDEDEDSPRSGLPDEQFIPFMENIEEAATATELAKFYKVAFNAAYEINDWTSIEKFKAAKAKRVKELE
jgi:cation transport regulator ChaB